jgi:hypothetical protein
MKRHLDNRRADWTTPQGLAKLRFLWARGDTAREIGAIFGVSKNAVAGMARRQNLPIRGTPIVRERVQVAKPLFRPTSTLPPLASELAAPQPTLAPTPANVGIAADASCSWLTGERPYRYCDAPTFGRLPYCACHAARAYESDAWRRREADNQPESVLMGDD